MNWVIASNNGGQQRGLNDAGVETFTGDYDRYLAREVIQNSLDARHDKNKPVRMEFQLATYDRAEIPDIDSLATTFVKCGEYWQHDKKTVEFFNRALSFAQAEKIPALRISDYNTTGVCGGDAERDKNWFNLIRCAGSSSKGGGEGGSFGIGKGAPFAASKMRGVLYSTFNVEQEHIFQGVSLIVSHIGIDGETKQNVAFLGGQDGASVRLKNSIPSQFLRKELGTDLFILGFPQTEKWEDDLARSVIGNFWPAIHYEDLEVTVGSINIKKATLEGLLQRYSETNNEDFTAHLYYKALTLADPKHQFPKELPLLGNVSLYVYVGDKDLPKRVAMVRKTGMVIFHKAYRSAMPYVGIFLCRNDQGNKLLREMEPPRHNEWDPNLPEKGANKKVEMEYTHFIRDCMRKLAPLDDSKEIHIPDLNKFLPDDEDTKEEEFSEDGFPEANETMAGSPAVRTIETKKVEVKRTALTKDHTQPSGGADETVDNSDSGQDNSTKHKKNTTTKGGDQNSGGRTGGQAGGNSPKPAIPLRFRTWPTNLSAGVYAVSASPIQSIEGMVNLSVEIIGDDQKAPAEIKSATLKDGKAIEVKTNGVIGPVFFPENQPLFIEIKLAEPMKVSMEVSAHEA